MDSVIVEVIFNDKPPTKYNYKHFDVVLDDGKIETFHYHIHNPMPTKDEMLGLTWEQLSELAEKMFYDKIKSGR
jgi:predicted phosphatase